MHRKMVLASVVHGCSGRRANFDPVQKKMVSTRVRVSQLQADRRLLCRYWADVFFL